GAEAVAGEAGQAGTLLPPSLTAVPIAHLALDECAGPASDSQSQAAGTRFNVGCTDGVAGKAASFSADVSDQGPRRIELADEPRFAFSHELTVAAWVRPEAGVGIQPIVAKWYAMDMFELAVRYVTDGQGHASPRFAFSIAEPEGDWGRPADAISPDEVVLQQWAHVAGVYRWSPDGQVGHITLYVNGQPVADTSTKVGTDGLQQSTRPVTIGYADQGSQFVGSIDEVRLYNVALGPEIAWLFLEPTHP
ncbi:MAG TPA: LamG domain-containing protein, partial [Polyangiaceae bacterium]|nr:LamG domain-containing protein [Polyangiaceae bacterium]